MGWSSANKDIVNLNASTDSPSTTTVDTNWQHAKIARKGNNQLKVGIFTHKNDPDGLVENSYETWNIIKETNSGLIATNNTNAMVSFSKTSGVLVYSKVAYSDSNFAPIAEQEAHIFSCKVAN